MRVMGIHSHWAQERQREKRSKSHRRRTQYVNLIAAPKGEHLKKCCKLWYPPGRRRSGGLLRLASQSGLRIQQLNLHFTPFQPVEHVAAVIDGRSVVLEVHLELRQDGAQSTTFLSSQITMKAVERP